MPILEQLFNGCGTFSVGFAIIMPPAYFFRINKQATAATKALITRPRKAAE